MSSDLNKLAEDLSSLTVLQLSELTKVLEEKWGVSAVTQVVAPAPATASDEPAKEKTEFDIVLKSFGSNKIAVIKEIRAITGLPLKEAKDLVESAPKTAKQAVAKEEAEEIKKKLESAGASVELK